MCPIKFLFIEITILFRKLCNYIMCIVVGQRMYAQELQMVCLIWFFTPSQQFFQLFRDGSSWVEQY